MDGAPLPSPLPARASQGEGGALLSLFYGFRLRWYLDNLVQVLLRLDEAVELALFLDELLVRADFGDLAVLQDHQPRGVTQRAQAMRDREGRAAPDQPRDGVLNLPLGVRIDGGSGLVEDQDTRIVQDRAGDAHPLPLAAAKRLAALADLRVVAVGLLDDEIVRVGGLGRGHDFLARGAWPGEGDVLVDRTAEEKRFLEHDANLRAQVLLRDLPDVHAVNEDLAFLDLIEAADQVDGGALARAALSHEADHLAPRDVGADLLEHRLVGLVAERHVLELHAP